MSKPRGVLRSSTLRTAVLAALVVWAPGAVLVSLQHRDWTRHVLGQAEREIDLHFEELFEEALYGDIWRLEEELGEPLDIEEIEDETEREFLARYVAIVRGERSDHPGIALRLAVLGEVDDGSLARAPLEALVELMEEEVPEEFHELLDELFEPHFEARDEEDDEDPEVDAAMLVAALEEGSEWLEESGACARLEDAAGRQQFASFEDVLETREIDRFTIVHVDGARPLEGRTAGLEPWCLVDERSLADGALLLGGPRVDEQVASIQRSAFRRNLVLALGLPLALVAGWLQSRPIHRFLAALTSAARRHDRGEVGARLEISPEGRDLALAADTVNRMLAQLDQTVRDLSRVSDSIAHDLRTPLSRLQGQLDLLKRSSGPSGELIEAVQEEADGLLETFNALLRIAQVESGVRKQGFREIDLAEIVHDVADLYGPVFADKGVAFTTAIPRKRVDYLGDRDLWLQALSNLVENALKYTPEAGEVRLDLDAGGVRPRIRLADSGPGIPESERDNVFRRFYRLDRHRGERGSGLGLSLVGAVCDLHGAQIHLSGDRGLVVDVAL